MYESLTWEEISTLHTKLFNADTKFHHMWLTLDNLAHASKPTARQRILGKLASEYSEIADENHGNIKEVQAVMKVMVNASNPATA